MTVMLVNIINYVGLCEVTPLEELAGLLNEKYYEPIGEAVDPFGGTINRIIADRVEITWIKSDPAEGALSACAASLKCANMIAKGVATLPAPFNINVAIATGKATGSKDIQLLGHLLNDAYFALELGKSLSKRILIDYTTYALVSGQAEARKVEKAFHNGSQLYELMGVILR